VTFEGAPSSRALAGLVIMVAGIGLIVLLMTSRPAGGRAVREPLPSDE
jgi:hypothetical protein